jgi:hypothetical protein
MVAGSGVRLKVVLRLDLRRADQTDPARVDHDQLVDHGCHPDLR